MAVLPPEAQEETIRYLNDNATWKDGEQQWFREFDSFAKDFFVVENEAALVRPLAFVCGYVNCCDVSFLTLKSTMTDGEEWEGDNDAGFQILQACGEDNI